MVTPHQHKKIFMILMLKIQNSSFTHPQVVPNLYVFICSDQSNQTDLNPH